MAGRGGGLYLDYIDVRGSDERRGEVKEVGQMRVTISPIPDSHACLAACDLNSVTVMRLEAGQYKAGSLDVAQLGQGRHIPESANAPIPEGIGHECCMFVSFYI